jgi:hypothetical protein
VAERGIKETYLKTGQLSIRVLQICGQGERRKWIHLFEGVTSIIFYVSLSDYDNPVVGCDDRVCLLSLLLMYVTDRS